MKRLYELMRDPRVYLWIQKTLGADRLRSVCLARAAPKAGERVLDLGCGPGQILDAMPAVKYVGFDTEAHYIAYAKHTYATRGEFHCEIFTDRHAAELEPFDLVLLLGLLHHIDDTEASDLLKRVARCLKPSGRAITLDPCYTHDQSWMSRKVAENDRGRFVRREAEYQALVAEHFGVARRSVLHNTCRIPSTELIMELSMPRAEGQK